MAGKGKTAEVLFLLVTVIVLFSMPACGYWATELRVPRMPEEELDALKEELKTTYWLEDMEISNIDVVRMSITVSRGGMQEIYSFRPGARFYLNGAQSCAMGLRPVTSRDFCLANLYFNAQGRLMLVEGLYYALAIEIQSWSREGGFLVTSSGEKISCRPDCRWEMGIKPGKEALVVLDFNGKARMARL
ncbi:MAG: hypothetical protein ACM3WV_08415 [Bacillota bacterium]